MIVLAVVLVVDVELVGSLAISVIGPLGLIAGWITGLASGVAALPSNLGDSRNVEFARRAGRFPALAAGAGGASMATAAARVTFGGALAMALTVGVRALFGVAA